MRSISPNLSNLPKPKHQTYSSIRHHIKKKASHQKTGEQDPMTKAFVFSFYLIKMLFKLLSSQKKTPGSSSRHRQVCHLFKIVCHDTTKKESAEKSIYRCYTTSFFFVLGVGVAIYLPIFPLLGTVPLPPCQCIKD